MRNTAVRLLTLATLSMALATAPVITKVYAAGDETPSTPAPSKGKSKKKGDGQELPSPEDLKFTAGYHTAYTTIYDGHDYTAAIDQLKALGHDDNAAVANLIGYSYRKLGNYKLSQVWYERALKDDPNHVKTWQYYGLWQLEQGNREQAEYHLTKISQLVGTDSDEYRSLASALAQPPGTGLVY
ncbi:MAG: tetratricopeptide repeat protein [Bradyrhizobium sp.]|uniref:tetratricopeptide repeat protein n=1 Tax=Bradyrhizobium sp. TaxID=376 RepID=UPI001D1D4DBE|nr:tetratricopeptide repeat protein [Bradyrhizobium sp.]MBV9565937.1 tetratricopeptide repeat protein [Bradyrhizobium sp.]